MSVYSVIKNKSEDLTCLKSNYKINIDNKIIKINFQGFKLTRL